MAGRADEGYQCRNMAQEITDPEVVWVEDERKKVLDYLAAEGCKHAGVADWPTFYVTPHLALWAVQSTRHVGRTGWWAISGDVPTDYMSSSEGESPQDALRYFAAGWNDVAGYMRRGEPHPELELGDPKNWPQMAEELEQRALALLEYADDPEIWE
jgi:hypothetical protein